MMEIEKFKKIILLELPYLTDDEVLEISEKMNSLADMMFSQWIQSIEEDV